MPEDDFLSFSASLGLAYLLIRRGLRGVGHYEIDLGFASNFARDFIHQIECSLTATDEEFLTIVARGLAGA